MLQAGLVLQSHLVPSLPLLRTLHVFERWEGVLPQGKKSRSRGLGTGEGVVSARWGRWRVCKVCGSWSGGVTGELWLQDIRSSVVIRWVRRGCLP